MLTQEQSGPEFVTGFSAASTKSCRKFSLEMMNDKKLTIFGSQHWHSIQLYSTGQKKEGGIRNKSNVGVRVYTRV